jgi:hypothetical protein
MRKVHITLIGGQTIPIYQLLLETLPDDVFLIHTKDSKAQAALIFDIYKLRQPEAQSFFIEIDPVSYSINLSIFDKIVKNDINSAINVTGGTKIMALALFEAAKNNAAQNVYYIDQNGELQNLINGKISSLNSSLSISEIFSLNNNPISQSTAFQSYQQSEIDSYNLMKELLNFDTREYYAIFKQVSRFTNQTSFITGAGSSLVYDSRSKTVEITLRKNQKVLTQKFSFPRVIPIVMNTGWYELFVAKAISDWKHSVEILLNVKVPFKTGADKNEIDIVLRTKKKLYFFECKTQIFDTKDIDKFAGVVKNYGGSGAKAFFITNEVLNERHLEKCHDQKIIPIQLNINTPDYTKFFDTLSAVYNVVNI